MDTACFLSEAFRSMYFLSNRSAAFLGRSSSHMFSALPTLPSW